MHFIWVEMGFFVGFDMTSISNVKKKIWYSVSITGQVSNKNVKWNENFSILISYDLKKFYSFALKWNDSGGVNVEIWKELKLWKKLFGINRWKKTSLNCFIKEMKSFNS